MNTKGCKIIRIVNEEELHFTWKGPDPFAQIMNQKHELTIVKVKFEKIDADTSKVIVEHSGFNDGEAWEEAFNWHKMAWSGVIGSLKSELEKGEGSLCCQPE